MNSAKTHWFRAFLISGAIDRNRLKSAAESTRSIQLVAQEIVAVRGESLSKAISPKKSLVCRVKSRMSSSSTSSVIGTLIELPPLLLRLALEPERRVRKQKKEGGKREISTV